VDFQESLAVLTTTDQTAQGAYADLVNDQLYLIQISDITEWRGGATNLTAAWKSKEFQGIKTPIWNSAIVIADAYTATVFKMYADGALVWTYSVTSDRAFRLPKFSRMERWSIQIETTNTVYEVVMGTNMAVLRTPNPDEPMR